MAGMKADLTSWILRAASPALRWAAVQRCASSSQLRSRPLQHPSKLSSTPSRLSSTAAASPCRVAVLYQAIDPPVVNGVRKPKKPGGYRDSGADIAYNLSRTSDVGVLAPTAGPRPEVDADWCFPDTEQGVLDALGRGATHLWANTILFAAHPLQTSPRVAAFQDAVRVVGQGPLVVDRYDDKEFVNDLLRRRRRGRAGGDVFPLPRAWTLRDDPAADLDAAVAALHLPFPVVAKPIRGRGSHGVRVCADLDALLAHARALFRESPALMVEEFLAGEEATVTVMPPSSSSSDGGDYWALPVVTRFNHVEGIAPYNGAVAVTANSRAVSDAEVARDPAYREVARCCEDAARVLGVAAPIRIDVRRRTREPGSEFALFDVNMKPNMTGPGRPGRDDQASLTLLAAEALGWDYAELLRRILATSSTLRTLRSLKPVA